MADIKIENIVGSTQIANSLDLNKLVELIPGSIYNPEEVPPLIIRSERPRNVVMLFSNGKVIFTGPKTMENAYDLTEDICKKLNVIGVNTYEKLDITIKNIVASSYIKKNLNLSSIAISLEKAEYNSKRFPGLIYKSDDPYTVILLFESGKIVCSGTESEEISIAIDRMTNELSSLGML